MRRAARDRRGDEGRSRSTRTVVPLAPAWVVRRETITAGLKPCSTLARASRSVSALKRNAARSRLAVSLD